MNMLNKTLLANSNRAIAPMHSFKTITGCFLPTSFLHQPQILPTSLPFYDFVRWSPRRWPHRLGLFPSSRDKPSLVDGNWPPSIDGECSMPPGCHLRGKIVDWCIGVPNLVGNSWVDWVTHRGCAGYCTGSKYRETLPVGCVKRSSPQVLSCRKSIQGDQTNDWLISRAPYIIHRKEGWQREQLRRKATTHM